jgi:uncharacterized protein YndB with AHSA1/START domain
MTSSASPTAVLLRRLSPSFGCYPDKGPSTPASAFFVKVALDPSRVLALGIAYIRSDTLRRWLMSLNEIQVDTPPAAVWDVLADPPSYGEWVVGTKEIRDHDRSWPAPGTEFHHKVGIGPLTVNDKSVCLEAQAPRRLVMNVRVLPVGHGIVTLELHEDGGRTLVRMEEHGAGGPVNVLWPVLEPLVKLRNTGSLRRLKRLAESRHRAHAGRG